MKLHLLLIGIIITLSSCGVVSKPDISTNMSTGAVFGVLATKNDTDTLVAKNISFTQAQKYLPQELPNTCTLYKSGCNTCAIVFSEGKFTYSCTELGCPTEPYECLYEKENDYFVIPETPPDISYFDGYGIGEDCSSIISSDDGKLVYRYLNFSEKGFSWSQDFTPYYIQQLQRNTDFISYIDGKSLCLADIMGNSFEEHPENIEIFMNFEEQVSQEVELEEIQIMKKQEMCLSYELGCTRTNVYYHYNNLSLEAKHYSYKSYSNKIPYCRSGSLEKRCISSVSEYEFDRLQEELDISTLNTPEILRNREKCFNRIGKIENTCVAYASECESCKVIYDEYRGWRWNFVSKGCTQKYISSQGGLPKMECNTRSTDFNQ